MEELTRRARLVKPDAVVWKGDHTLSPQQQGIRVLGAPVGSAEYVQSQLEQKSVEQETLFFPQDSQASWLLLLMCVATRSSFWLRIVRPEQVQNFAERHDLHVAAFASHSGHRRGTRLGQDVVQFAVVPRWFGAQLRCQVHSGQVGPIAFT